MASRGKAADHPNLERIQCLIAPRQAAFPDANTRGPVRPITLRNHIPRKRRHLCRKLAAAGRVHDHLPHASIDGRAVARRLTITTSAQRLVPPARALPRAPTCPVPPMITTRKAICLCRGFSHDSRASDAVSARHRAVSVRIVLCPGDTASVSSIHLVCLYRQRSIAHSEATSTQMTWRYRPHTTGRRDMNPRRRDPERVRRIAEAGRESPSAVRPIRSLVGWISTHGGCRRRDEPRGSCPPRTQRGAFRCAQLAVDAPRSSGIVPSTISSAVAETRRVSRPCVKTRPLVAACVPKLEPVMVSVRPTSAATVHPSMTG